MTKTQNAAPILRSVSLRLPTPVRSITAAVPTSAGSENGPGRRENSGKSHPSTGGSATTGSTAAGGPATADASAAQTRKVLQSLTTELAKLGKAQADLQQHLESQAIELAVTIAGCILRREITSNSFPLHDILRELLDGGGEPVALTAEATVFVHPSDLVSLKKSLDPKERIVKWNADRGLPRGSVRVDGIPKPVFYSAAFHLEDLHRLLKEVASDTNL